MYFHHFGKGDNSCDLPFAFLEKKAPPKWDQLWKEKNLLLREQFFSFQSCPSLGREANMKLPELFPLIMYLFT